jgi:hypothetical protein
MKKIYTLFLTLVSFAFFNSVFAQYTASRTGNWSNNVTWAPGAAPAAFCNNCTVTINANVTVTLDAAVILNGTSTLILNDNAKLIIPNSGNAAFGAHNTITLENPSTIRIGNGAVIDASTAGRYDGIFNSFPVVLPIPGVNFKLVGTPAFGNAPTLGNTITGPIVVSSTGGTTPLPVILVDFNAVLDKGSVDVSWTTEAEINADHFNVQYSSNGSDFETRGVVAATGNSSIPVNYSYADRASLASVNYYRLQSVDKDGKYAYSEVKAVRGSLISGFSVFPNPATDNVFVTLSSHATSDLTLRLINANGQVLQEKKASNAAGTTVSFAVHMYPAGTYLLQIKGADGTQQTSKLVISR